MSEFSSNQLLKIVPQKEFCIYHFVQRDLIDKCSICIVFCQANSPKAALGKDSREQDVPLVIARSMDFVII